MKKINIKSSKNNFDYNVIDSFLRKIKSEPLNNDEIKILKDMCECSQSSVLNYINKKSQIKSKKITIVQNNQIFNKLLERLDLLSSLNSSIDYKIIFDGLNVKTKNKNEVTFHNLLKITINSDSYIKISPTIGNSIEITIIHVDFSKRRKKIGTLLISTVIKFCEMVLGYRPRFVLECVGSLESDGIYSSTGISNQIAFFRKFDFRVENRKHYPNYVMMSSPESDINKNEEMYQLAA